MKRYQSYFLFFVALIMVAYFYSYHEIVFKRPQSVHQWRQSDCASIALNYHQGNMNFFQPETHNLTSNGGTTGHACTSEIPFLYYGVAILYRVMGYNEAIFRILNTLLFFVGLFYLFRIVKHLLKDDFWAISVSLLFFTSPVLVFYGNNFLSNSSALAFSLVGWFYFMLFYSTGRPRWYTIAILMFFIAASFKITALFSLFAIGFMYLSELLGLTKFKKEGKLFNKSISSFIALFIAVFVIAAWVFYARYYNGKHDSTYFSTTTFPIWMLDSGGVMAVLENIREIWFFQYFHGSVHLFLGICSIAVIVFYRRNLKVLNYALGFILFEVIVYVLLQFQTFKDHDYYTIDIYILPILVTISFAYILKDRFKRLYSSPISKLLFTVFVLFNVYYAQKIHEDRYYGWMNNNGVLSDAHSISDYLRGIGINAKDTVISIPDGSNVSLYLMNQKGWTEYSDARLNRETPIPYNRDSTGIEKSIMNGAKYIIVNGVGQLYEKAYLQYFCRNLVGRYNNTLIFTMATGESNFNLPKRQVKERLFCNSELLTSDKKSFLNLTDSTVFKNGDAQSMDYALSGRCSSKLSNEYPYGYTITIKDVKYGESIRFSVWRKENSKGTIIASAEDYYNNTVEISETRNGWQKLNKEFFITKELAGKELGFYAYNPDQEPAYFDDFELVLYKSVIE